jgi:hypothetical protein
MKKFIILVLAISTALNLSAQDKVTNKSGKEVTVNKDATSTEKGSVKLTGDLGGTADAPTVPALSSKIDGTGTINFIPKFTGTKSLGNSLLFDNGTYLGLGTISPGNKLEITQGTAGNSGLRFTNLNSSSTATTSSSKVLGLNSSGDVILTNVPGTQNIVDFSTATPTTSGVVFTPDTPADESVVYQSAVDNSMWTYNGTAYVTYNAPASTAWFTAGTTNDAGNSKTSNIYRTGNVGIGISTPAIPLDVRSAATGAFVATARFQSPNLTAGQAALLNFGVNSTSAGNSADWRFHYAGNASASNRVDFGMTGYATPIMSYLVNGNVGIGSTAPAARLHIQGIQATLGANANATMLRMSRPTWSGNKWGSVAQFNLGTYVDGGNNVDSKSRLDLALTNGNDETTLTTTMTWLANGNVGINNTAPSAPLVVQGVTGTGALKLIAPSVASGDNWWLGFGHGTTSTDANDRARIGVDVVAGGAGRLFFTTGPTGTQTRAMFIDESQRVGIGTSIPNSRLDVLSGTTEVARFTTSLIQSNYAGIGIGNGSGAWGKIAAGDSKFQIRNFSTDATVFHADLSTGNVGIGTTSPTSKLEVNGAATNTTAFNAAAGTSVDFSKSNLAYTSASAGAFTLTNLKDGGSYTLAVQGTTSGTASFTSTGFTFRSVNNGATITGKQTLYTFIVMGTTVYFYMAAGF